MDYLIGHIIHLPYHFDIEGAFPCRGQTLEVKNYPALFSLIGYNFGGDGRDHFALPDLRPYSDAGPDFGHHARREWRDGEIVQYIVYNGIYPQRI